MNEKDRKDLIKKSIKTVLNVPGAPNSATTISSGRITSGGMIGSNGPIGTIGMPGTIGIAKSSYHILGEDVEFNGYKDGMTTVIISTLNVLGKPFYDELKKNGVSFPDEIESFLKIKFRDLRIDDILN